MTFCKRKRGLLKKAAELGRLCGVKVALLFTDMAECVHYFTTDPSIGVQYEHTLSKMKEGSCLFRYLPENVESLFITSILLNLLMNLRNQKLKTFDPAMKIGLKMVLIPGQVFQSGLH